MSAKKNFQSEEYLRQRILVFRSKLELGSYAVDCNTGEPLPGRCWTWVGSRNDCGYGSFGWAGKPCSIHRWSYQTFVGEIPKGMHVHHLCDNRACANFNHLELTTNRDNTTRGRLSLLNPGRSSKHVGVSWQKASGKWLAQIYANGKSRYLGIYTNELDAAAAYQEALRATENDNRQERIAANDNYPKDKNASTQDDN